MSTLLLSSSFIIGLSLIRLSLSASASWSDDGKLSFDGDLGWAFYDKTTPTIDRCLSTNCQVQDTLTTPTTYYYGPVSNEYLILKRRFECPYKADVSLTYKVAACDVPGMANKDFTRSEVKGSQSVKSTITSSTILSTSLLDTSECSSTNYFTQTVSATSANWNVLKDERFEVKLKVKAQGGNVGTAYLYDIEITCTEITTTTPPPGLPTSSPTEKPHTSMSDLEFCIEGFDGTDSIYNGEYILMDVQVNGENAYEKNDYQARSFFYYKDSEWYYSTELNSADTNDIIATRGCGTPAPTVANDDCDSGEVCECVIDSNGDPISLVRIDGECEDAHVTLSNVSPVGLFNLSQETETLFMLITLCFVSFIAGMLTCGLCKLVCNNKKSDKEREYEKVSVKDADIEFSN